MRKRTEQQQRNRDIVREMIMKGMRNKQISEVTGIPCGTIKGYREEFYNEGVVLEAAIDEPKVDSHVPGTIIVEWIAITNLLRWRPGIEKDPHEIPAGCMHLDDRWNQAAKENIERWKNGEPPVALPLS